MTFDEWWEKINRTYDSDSVGFPNYRTCWDASAKQYEDRIKGKILVDKEDFEFKVFRIAELETALRDIASHQGHDSSLDINAKNMRDTAREAIGSSNDGGTELRLSPEVEAKIARECFPDDAAAKP